MSDISFSCKYLSKAIKGYWNGDSSAPTHSLQLSLPVKARGRVGEGRRARAARELALRAPTWADACLRCWPYALPASYNPASVKVTRTYNTVLTIFTDKFVVFISKSHVIIVFSELNSDKDLSFVLLFRKCHGP